LKKWCQKRRFALPASRQRTPSRRRARSTPGRRCTAFCCSCGTSARSRAAAGGPSCRILLVGGGSDSPHRLAPPHSKTKPTARSAAADRHPVRGHSKPSRSNRIVPFAVPSLCYIKYVLNSNQRFFFFDLLMNAPSCATALAWLLKKVLLRYVSLAYRLDSF
jgi:hypothetical protein